MRIYFFFLTFFLVTQNSFAQVMDSIHYSWKVFELEEEIEGEIIKRCYVMSVPKSSKTNYTGDREAYVSISRFEHERREEVSISAGFQYKINSNIYSLIGKEDFELFTRGSSAWFDRATKDKRFIQKMLDNDSIKVRSDSAIGSYAVDTYSLKGFARAYKRMKDLCP